MKSKVKAGARASAAPAKKDTRPARAVRPAATASRTPERGAVKVKRAGKLPQTARPSKTEAEMTEKLDSLEPGSVRYRVLVAAIDFKRSWLELAEYLTDVQRSGSFKEWGYRTFEAYASHELHLRKDTVLKLTRSYDFLESNEPELLETRKRRDEERPTPIPTFQALDVLAEARANPQLSEDDYREIRDQVFGEDLTPAQVKKLVKDRAPEQVKEKPEDDPLERVRKCLQLAERLYGLILEEDSIPERIAQAVEEAVGGLRRMLEE